MKTKINQLIKIGILIFGIIFFLTSCETDNETVETNLEQEFSIKELAFTEFNTNSRLIEKISSIQRTAKNKTNTASRTNSPDEVYEINTNHAIYIENTEGSHHTYTFAVNSQGENSELENIVLSLQEDGSYKAFLTTYNLTEQQLADLNNGLELSVSEDSSSITEVGYDQVNFMSRMGCTYELTTIEVEHACTIDGCWDPQYTTIEYINVWVEVCSGGGGGGSGDGSGTGTGSGGGGTGSGGGGSVPTKPVGIQNEEDPCNPAPVGDLNGDCMLDFYEACLVNGYSDNVCDCVSEGENLSKCVNAEEINAITLSNPYALLEIDCNQIQNWQTLAQHTAPQSVLDKIGNLPSSWANDFEIQSLDEANGTVVNLDYFSVNITSLPNNPSTNQQFTADDFLDYMRRNFNDFVNGSTFNPYCEIPSMCQTETTLWNSNNPLGSIIYIDITGDDGVVVCTEYTNSYWYFMTMNAPYAGNHPVSGTRQFGYEQNANGSFNFFVRGVDRFDSNVIENSLYVATLGNPFFGADSLWTSFQDKTNQFVNNNGGSSTIVTPIKNRPDWDKVEEVLNGERPISDLGCN